MGITTGGRVGVGCVIPFGGRGRLVWGKFGWVVGGLVLHEAMSIPTKLNVVNRQIFFVRKRGIVDKGNGGISPSI